MVYLNLHVKLSVEAVLLQQDRPVEYATKTLNKTQQGYTQIEKELLVYDCECYHLYVKQIINLW